MNSSDAYFQSLSTKVCHFNQATAKVLGKTNFQPREIPRSGSKAIDRKERKRGRHEERAEVSRVCNSENATTIDE